jgi:hypothetical protein
MLLFPLFNILIAAGKVTLPKAEEVNESRRRPLAQKKSVEIGMCGGKHRKGSPVQREDRTSLLKLRHHPSVLFLHNYVVTFCCRKKTNPKQRKHESTTIT